MITWQPLSSTFNAHNGLSVQPVATADDLALLGRQLNNGLQISEPRDAWAKLCEEGRRQILRIVDGERVIACSELRVRGGGVEAIFVRGPNNIEFNETDAELEAVTEYLAAVNAREIPLNFEIGNDALISPAVIIDRNPWAIAQRLHEQRGISPFAALTLGLDGNDLEVTQNTGPIFEDMTWTPMTASSSSPDGFVFEPIGSRSGLRKVGEELENNLFNPMFSASTARRCQSGESQFAAIYPFGETNIVGFAEFKVVGGLIVPVMCRALADRPGSPAMQNAVTRYARRVNGGAIELNVAISANGFVVEGADLPDPEAGIGEIRAYIEPSLPIASRTNGTGGWGNGFFGNDQNGGNEATKNNGNNEGYEDEDGTFYSSDKVIRNPADPTGWIAIVDGEMISVTATEELEQHGFVINAPEAGLLM